MGRIDFSEETRLLEMTNLLDVKTSWGGKLRHGDECEGEGVR